MALRYTMLLFIALVLLSGQALLAQEDTLRIVTTTTQSTDLVTILSQGVDNITITGLMGAGVDPHLYQPTESDTSAMSDANMVVYSGLHLEGQLDTVFEALGEQGVVVYALSQSVKDAGFIIGDFDFEGDIEGTDDPHFWFDPRNWEITTLDLAETLARLDPPNANIYLTNATTYIEQLQYLYAWANEGMRSIPEEQRYLVTSHDAFQYFGAGFGWQVASIQGISTEDEAGVGDIQEIVRFVVNNDVPVIFVESSVSPNTIRAVIEAVQASGGKVRIGIRELYSDAMDEPDIFGGTYIGMIAHNVYTILQSYECAGIEVIIPDWHEDLITLPTEEFLAVDCNF